MTNFLKHRYFVLLMILGIMVSFDSCKDDDEAKPSGVPEIVTAQITDITSTSALGGGTISTDGGVPVIARGVCWSTVVHPTTADSKTVDGTGTGSFTSTISDLLPATTYYVRAYASNTGSDESGDAFTAYGEEFSFTTAQAPGPDIYVAGTTDVGAAEWAAAYWKNGEEVLLSDGAYSASVLNIFVSGEDVHVVGSEYNAQDIYTAKYWKNGTSIPLSSEYSEAYCVFVSGADVYVGGWEASQQGIEVATYWKNGNAVPVSDGSQRATIESMVVIGADVYAAGWTQDEVNSGKQIAIYWKNGVSFPLTSGTTHAKAHSIAVSGSDVYVAGYETNDQGRQVGTYWKNGVAVPIVNETSHVDLKSIFVKGSDVYVSGQEMVVQTGVTYARYWKNGSLGSLNAGEASRILDFKITDDGDVYSLVERSGDSWTCDVFKNETATGMSFNEQDNYVNTLFVVNN